MADKHANMPGMKEQAKKPAQEQSPEKLQKAPQPKQPDKSAQHDKSGHQH